MNVTNSIFKELRNETLNLSTAVKIAKKTFDKSMIKKCVEKVNSELSKSNKLNINETVNGIYSVFQLSTENLIVICRFYSMQLDGIFCKKVILRRENKEDISKNVSNIDKYPMNVLLYGTNLKNKGFRTKTTVYPEEFKEKPLITFLKSDKENITYGFIKNDKFSLYFVLDAIRDYIKAGCPEIDTLKTK